MDNSWRVIGFSHRRHSVIQELVVFIGEGCLDPIKYLCNIRICFAFWTMAPGHAPSHKHHFDW